MQQVNTRSKVLCSEMVRLTWKDQKGSDVTITGDLEAISPSHAWLQTDCPITESTSITIGYGPGSLSGVVRGCTSEDQSFGLRVELDIGTQWSRRRYSPQHLLDPTVLVVHNLLRELSTDIGSVWKPLTMTA